jgi:acetate kinase
LNQNGDGLVSAATSRVDILAIPADEEFAVARDLLAF